MNYPLSQASSCVVTHWWYAWPFRIVAYRVYEGDREMQSDRGDVGGGRQLDEIE